MAGRCQQHPGLEKVGVITVMGEPLALVVTGALSYCLQGRGSALNEGSQVIATFFPAMPGAVRQHPNKTGRSVAADFCP